MNKIKLNFVNKSSDTSNNSVVIFQKNVAEGAAENAIAWKVIENCGPMENHPFQYSPDLMVAAGDAYGNYTPQLTGSGGLAFDMVRSTSGELLEISATAAASSTGIEVRNNLDLGAINANCYRDGRLLAREASLAPGEKAVFEFHPAIYIGVVSQVEEGDVISADVISQINFKISLLGIKSADIVMTGGGYGTDATAFKFTLENVRY